MDRATVREILGQITDFKETGKGFNFRCVVCGDSKKSLKKRRGWILPDKTGKFFYYCHNCGYSKSLYYFTKENYPDLFKKYFRTKDIKQLLLNDTEAYIKVEPKHIEEQADITEEFHKHSFGLFEKQTEERLQKLQYTALMLIRKRLIPKEYYQHFRVCYDGLFKDRMFIPYFDDKGHVYCFQARDLTGKKEDSYKYLTNKPENNTKIFNFFIVDPEKDVLVLEGPIDAMFLPNAIATSGLVRWETDISEEIILRFPKRIWVMDNDRDGKAEAINFAENKERVFCWPRRYKYKDINDLKVAESLTQDDLYEMILRHTYTGFEAVMKLKM